MRLSVLRRGALCCWLPCGGDGTIHDGTCQYTAGVRSPALIRIRATAGYCAPMCATCCRVPDSPTFG